MVLFIVYLLTGLADVASDLAKQEARGWIPVISKRIIRRVVERLPVEQRDILEDMEAELDQYSDRPISMLLVAMRMADDQLLIVAEARALAVEPGGKHQSKAVDVADELIHEVVLKVNSWPSALRVFVWSAWAIWVAIMAFVVEPLFMPSLGFGSSPRVTAFVIAVIAPVVVYRRHRRKR